ncbi:MAG TPA: DUF167 domain-containing protein [Candidatus Sumerlaeota bacterium]|nr:MAG: hypothetical protein BWY12_00320 [candidate division BRC1 bacterium ADurb.Bin183]HOE62159.1 DUF167 domain-containing protein [Candidatus Sumerlaeota bacterium]HRR30224.1 DUF167 domain-containing protein [Candidatus Sumerlaeia bacterium]HON49074.1 DUF167 domain-containing protein [Candidatus Sumerlaeota bacterium]HOR64319.1 DUF167 domain-containing protein [Candidatus Sumerlaeota bacterium]
MVVAAPIEHLNFSKVNGIEKKGADAILLRTRVVPRSSRTVFVAITAEGLRLQVKAPPVENAANEECIRFLAKTFGVSKGAVRLSSGGKSRAKVFEIDGCAESDAVRIIESLNLKVV